MDLQVTKNIQFTRLVKAPVQQREFNFRRIPNVSTETFHVDVSDDRMNRIIFKMEKKDTGSWKIIDHIVPDWVSNVEQQLNDILETSMQPTWKSNDSYA